MLECEKFMEFSKNQKKKKIGSVVKNWARLGNSAPSNIF